MKANTKKYELVWHQPVPTRKEQVSSSLFAALDAGSTNRYEPYLQGKYLKDIPESKISKGDKFYGLESYRKLSQLGTSWYYFDLDSALKGHDLKSQYFGDSDSCKSGKRINDLDTCVYRLVGFPNKLARFVRS